MPENFMTVFWLVLLIVLVVVEASTAQLVTIWFAVGSLAALISSLFGAEIYLQWIIFVAVSAVALAVTRPLVKKLTKNKVQPTNADRCIGQTAIVIQEIDNDAASGQVKIGGAVWTARSADGEKIAADEKVKIEKIDGVKVIVTKI